MKKTTKIKIVLMSVLATGNLLLGLTKNITACLQGWTAGCLTIAILTTAVLSKLREDWV